MTPEFNQSLIMHLGSKMQDGLVEAFNSIELMAFHDTKNMPDSTPVVDMPYYVGS